MLNKFLCIISILLLPFSLVKSQTTTHFSQGYKVEHFTAKDGVPNWFSAHAVQDDNGYLWTTSGAYLVKYDGYVFKKYKPHLSVGVNELPGSNFEDIVIDKQGYVWGANAQGLVRFDPVKEQFQLIKEETFKEEGCRTARVFHFEKDKQEDIWIGAMCGLYKIELQKDSFQIISWGPQKTTSSFNIIVDSLIANSSHNTVYQIEKVTNDTMIQQSFEVAAENEKFLLITLGEKVTQIVDGLVVSFDDFGWITNEKRDTIWHPQKKQAYYAGGSSKNYLILDTITLTRGQYILNYQTDDSHAYGSWNAAAPEKVDWWGIKLLSLEKEQKLDTFNKTNNLLTNGYASQQTNTYPFVDDERNLFIKGADEIFSLDVTSAGVSFQKVHDLEIYLGGIEWIETGQSGKIWFISPFFFAGGRVPMLSLFDPITYDFTTIKHNLPANTDIIQIAEDCKGKLWIATYQQGVFVLAPPFVPVTDSLGQPNLQSINMSGNETGVSTSYSSFWSINEDKYCNIWVGSETDYLYKISEENTSTSYYKFSNKIGLTENTDVLFVNVDNNDKLWGAVTDGTIILISPEGKSVKFSEKLGGVQLYDEANSRLEGNNNTTAMFHVDSEDNLWFGGFGKIIKYNPMTELASEYKFRKGKNAPFVSKLLQDQKGNFWLLGTDRAIYLFNNFSGNFQKLSQGTLELNYYERVFEKSRSDYSHLYADNNRGVWLFKASGYGGIIHLEKKANKIDTLFQINMQTLCLDLKQDEKGNIYLATAIGLKYVDVIKDTVFHYGEEHGLTNNMIWSLQMDDEGNIWVNSSGGIQKFDVSKKEFLSFRQLDGYVYPNWRGVNSFLKDKNGNFIVNDNKGYLKFHPSQLKKDETPPQIHIIKINASGRNITSRLDLTEEEIAPFRYNQNDLSFKFIGIHFNDAMNQNYQYQLEDVDKDWVSADKERIARYPNLPPGNYTFKVKAANADGIWSEPTAINITILSPWWQTWWAYAFYVLATVGGTFWYIQSLRKKVKQKQAQLDRELSLNNELTLLNQANQRFVPNDFLNILGKNSIKDLQLGDQTKTKMTVLFSDIRDYTPLSESMTPEENFKFINAYLGRIGPIIKAHGGFISSYLGDGLMALFVNEPEKAIQATIAMQKALETYNQERKAAGKRPLRTGMGLNTGDLMLGVIGDQHRYESTVISDAVNTASRMEGLTKAFGAAIILSERTLAGLRGRFERPRNLNADKEELSKEKLEGRGKRPSNRDFAYRYLGKVKVKGKDKALKIYDLYEGETVAIRELKAQTKLQFEQGITHYFNRGFGKAAECFKQVLVINEADKAAQYYLDKSVYYIVNGVAEDWSGVEEMVMK